MADFNFLDLVPVLEHGTVADAMHRAALTAKAAEAAGYKRYWVAEHHGMAGIAGGATSVVLAHVGAATSTIRIGAGGIMLPNHAPLQIAEQFGTLDALYPGRIDLGLGRAPGSDQRVSRAIRRTLTGSSDDFPRDVVELQGYFAGSEDAGFVATPGAGADPEIWILGSSTFGAQLAAYLGLPFGFASHFAPQMLDSALRLYRENFRPSARHAAPRVMVGYNVFAADDAEEAELLASSQHQSIVQLLSGQVRGGLRPPVPGYYDSLAPSQQAGLANFMQFSATGTRETVREGLRAMLARTGADEVIIGCQIFDHAARMKSIAIAADAMRDLAGTGALAGA